MMAGSSAAAEAAPAAAMAAAQRHARTAEQRAVQAALAAARRRARTAEERGIQNDAIRRKSHSRSGTERARIQEIDRERKRKARLMARERATSAEVPESGQPESTSAPAEDAGVAGPQTRHGGRWSEPGDTSFDGAIEVHHRIKVRPEWAEAARYAVDNHPSQKKESDPDLEVKTAYSWAFMHGSWTSWKGKGRGSPQDVRRKHLEALQDVEGVMRHRARAFAERKMNANRCWAGGVELKTLVVRAYSGGPGTGEFVKKHTDHVLDENGDEETRAVVSVVLVLKGGFDASGYDVRIHGEEGRFYFPHLEEGDALLLEGGGDGVVHDVGFYHDPAARKRWSSRVSVVAFYAVGHARR